MIQTAIFLADGFEEIEGLTVVDICRRANIDILMVSVTGKKEVTGSHNICVMADTLIENVNFDALSFLILPGGMPGTLNLKACDILTKRLIEFNDKDKNLAAICAAPTVLGELGILEGRNACCYPGCEKGMLGAKVCEKQVIRDGNVITSRGMGTAIPFALAIVAEIKGQKAAQDLAESIVYKE